MQGFDCICKHGAFENQVQFIWLKTPHLIFETRSEESTVTPSFVAVPVANLAAIFLEYGLFTSCERSCEKAYQKRADERFDVFICLFFQEVYQIECSEDRCDTHRSDLHSQHFLDFGVVTAGAQDDLHV